MYRETRFWGLIAALFMSGCFVTEALAQEDVADIPSRSFFAGQDPNKRYFLVGVDEQTRPSEEGFGLVVVLAGGDGGADFNPFVRRIYKNALSKEYVVAQLVAVKWTAQQQIVWPTGKLPVAGQEFSTEEFIEAVIEDVKAKYVIDANHIFTLSWSSGGPAAYAYSLGEQKSATGSFIAMSVFKPKNLPPLSSAGGHGYFLLHSPTDRVCPFSMAQQGEKELVENGATVKLSMYSGGHGWKGSPYSRIRYGIRWLEKNHAEPAKRPERKAEPEVDERGEEEPPEKVTVTDRSVDTGLLLPVRQDGKWGYINEKGQIEIEPRFSYANDFSDGLANVVIEKRWGYIDKSGQMVIKPQFDYADRFSEGLAVVNIAGRYGYIDKTGKVVIEPEFEVGCPFQQGVARVWVRGVLWLGRPKHMGLRGGGEFGYIDKTGNCVWQPGE